MNRYLDRGFNRGFVQKTPVTEDRVYPPDTTFVGVTSPEVTRPNYLQSKNLSFFGTKITRITNSQNWNTTYHDYPIWGKWSVDGKYIFIKNSLIDGNDYSYIRPLETGLGIGFSEWRWSNVDPEKFYWIQNDNGPNPGYIMQHNVVTNTSTVVYPLTGFRNVEFGLEKGNIDYSDRYFPLSAKSGSDLIAIIYDNFTNSIHAQRTFPGLHGVGAYRWIMVTNTAPDALIIKDDTRVVSDNITELRRYDMDLNFEEVFLSPYVGHGCMAIDDRGDECFVRVHRGRDIRTTRISDGDDRIHLPQSLWQQSGWTDAHIGAANCNRFLPGWASVTNKAMKEVFMLKLDESQTVRRFANTHSSKDSGNKYGAWGTANPWGDKLMFKTNWDYSENDDIVYSYIAEMPTN